jgi:hypothetical protein
MDNADNEAWSAAIDAAAVRVCEGGQGMSAKGGREASDQAAWRRRGKALARVLEAVENHKVDWRESKHIRKALEEVDSLLQPDVELYMGVEMAAGWLAHLIREFALNENATLHQMQFIIATARGIIENGGLALSAQRIIGSREVDFASKPLKDELHARKESQKKQTEGAAKERRRRKEFLDERVRVRAEEYLARPGISKRSRPWSIARGIIDSVNSDLKAEGMEEVGDVVYRDDLAAGQ